jgi:ribosomal protein S18 acetylase RimI-like enzyme
MDDVLTDLSSESLVAAIRGNASAWWRYLGSSSKAEYYDSPELSCLLTGIPTPSMNTVVLKHVDPGRAGEFIDRTLAHVRSRGVAKCSWWMGPGAQPAVLGPHLEARGLPYREGAPGMAVDLVALNEDLPAPAGLTIEHVEETETLSTWAHAAFVGLGLPVTSVQSGIDLFEGLGFDLPLRSYLGFLDGEPVATSQLFLGAGVAGIYVVSTLPQARRQGIGTTMTLAPLREARALGFRIGILHSSPMGVGMYRRLGFQETCRMSHHR